ncbi:MAG: hypothetical protein Q8L37_05830 [Candidatus Gottesmanbacteria bacterium]|nr:hypothetical protein [Candidatus Gottesmanbacteria bacterium]
MNKTQTRQSGQIVLISLLVLSIATTIALSLIGRSTTDVAISNQITESSRAFSAAEAGIEEALKTGVGTSGAQVLTAGVTYAVAKADIGGALGAYVFPKKVSRGTTETLWLVNHNADGTLIETPTYTSPTIDVCWSQESVTPALSVAIVYKTAGGLYRMARGSYDSDSTRALTNKFSGVTASTGGCGAGTGTTYKQTITFGSFTPAVVPASDTLLMVRIVPLYADASIAVNTTSALALQGSKLESTGTSGNGITRKIVVYQQYRSPPSVFDSVIYSQGSFGH